MLKSLNLKFYSKYHETFLVKSCTYIYRRVCSKSDMTLGRDSEVGDLRGNSQVTTSRIQCTEVLAFVDTVDVHCAILVTETFNGVDFTYNSLVMFLFPPITMKIKS